MKKKLYYVKREVKASSIKQAMSAKGVIYAIEEAAQQPEEEKKIDGFKQKLKS